MFKKWKRSVCVGVSAHAWNITVCDLVCFLVSSPRLQVAPVDRFSRSIRQTTRFRASKCLLGSRWWIFKFTPFCSPKIWKFALRPMATSNDNNSGIFKDRSEMFAPKWGFSGSGNLMVYSKFVYDRPLLPWQPTGDFWTQNLLNLSLYKR